MGGWGGVLGQPGAPSDDAPLRSQSLCWHKLVCLRKRLDLAGNEPLQCVEGSTPTRDVVGPAMQGAPW